MGGGGRGMLAQHVPFDLEAFVPPFTFFFFPTFAPLGGDNEGMFISIYNVKKSLYTQISFYTVSIIYSITLKAILYLSSI